MNRYVEIGLASAFGAAAGILTGLAFGWNLFFCIPLGALAGFLSYQPREIGKTVKALCREIREGFQEMVVERRQIINEVLRRAGVLFHILSCLALAVFVLSIVPAVLFFTGVATPEAGFEDPFGDSRDGDKRIMFCMLSGLLLACAGGMAVVSMLSIEESKSRRSFPITRWLEARLALNEVSLPEESSKTNELWASLLIPAFLQMLSLVLVIIALDILVALASACSATERLAATFGATLGALAGAICQWYEIPYSPAILTAGIVVGFVCGSSIYWLRCRIEVVRQRIQPT